MEETVQSDRAIKENSLLAIITNRNLINVICFLVVITSPLIVYRRIMVDWVASQNVVNLLSDIHGLSMGIPFYFVMLMYMIMYFPKLKVFSWLDKITNLKVISIIAIPSIIICYILYLVEVPASLGSWTTIAVVIAGLLWFCMILQGKMRNILVFSSAIGLLGIWIGIWEIPYQTALKLFYDLPQVGGMTAFQWIVWEWVIEVPMAGCGIWLLAELNKKYKIVRLNKAFWIFTLAYVALTALWFGTGMWVDVWYDWTLHKWIQSPEFSKAMMFVYKLSKVVMLLALVSMIWRNKHETAMDNSSMANT